MNSFFKRLKDYFKTGVRKLRDVAKTAADNIKEFIKRAKLRLVASAESIRQTVQGKIRSLKDAFKRPTGTAESRTEQQKADSDSAADAPKAERTESNCTDSSSRHRAAARHFFTHAADFLAGFLFFSAVVIALKPQLLGKALGLSFSIPEKEIIQYTEKIGSYLIQLKITEDIEPNLKIARNVFVTLFLALYIALKISVVLFVKNQVSQKVVSVLMIALTLIACTLLSENFLTFSAVCLIASFAFAFSCGFPARTIFRKLTVFIIVVLCCYVAAHILTDYDDCRESLLGIGDAIISFGKNTAEFFSALSISLR